MSVSENTARQLLREYFEDYSLEDRFIYTFGGEQFLVKECINRSGGVSKSGILELFNEYFDNYHTKDNYIVDMHSCHFLIGLQTAIIKEIAEGQKRITRKEFFTDSGKSSGITSRHIFDDNVLKSGFGENELTDIHYCELKDKHCAHADTANNDEIGFIICSGEYCDIELKIPCKKGFGENEILD